MRLACSILYNPVGSIVIDREGVKRIRRVYGLKQRSLPGDTVLWHRDINAAINILLTFLHFYHHGELPWEFRRSTDPTELVRPRAVDYHYKQVPGKVGYARWTS